MKKDYYTINDIARMTMLSTRTIRTYIKNGILNGKKDSGIWVFTEEDLGRFLAQDYVKQGVQIKSDAIIRDFLVNKKKNRNSLCSIYDYPVNSKAQAEKLCDSIVNVINTDQFRDITFSYYFEEKDKMVRIIITGQTERVSKLVRILDKA